MEFKLNKIDTDLRQRINEERSEDKIHNKKGININKDKNKEEKNQGKGPKEAEHNGNLETVEKKDSKEEVIEPQKGHYIDIRR
jgi:hypothetical protein